MQSGAGKERIPELDAFRAIAISSVVFYHYYWLHTHLRHPATDDFFSFGFLGVPFFFVISGFVIAATLGTSRGFPEFWKKRAIRLMPAMVTCSLISLFFFRLVDPPPNLERNASLTNFFYSITFIHPDILNVLLKPFEIRGVTLSGSYWSLWPEVQFYLLVSLIYFRSRDAFYTRFISVAVVLCGMFYITDYLWAADILQYNEHGLAERFIYVINLPRFLHWFLAGVLFYGLWTGRRDALTWMALAFCILIMANDMKGIRNTAYILAILGLFFTLVFRRNLLRLFQSGWIPAVGVASYGLYLIHENMGYWLILRFGPYMGKGAVLLPLLVAGIMVAFSLALLRYFEQPVSRFLKRTWIKGKS